MTKRTARSVLIPQCREHFSFVRSFSRCVRRLAGWRAVRAGGRVGAAFARCHASRRCASNEWHGCLHRMHNDITPSPVSAAEGQVNFNSPCSVVNSSSHFKAFCCQLKNPGLSLVQGQRDAAALKYTNETAVGRLATVRQHRLS